MINRGSRPKVYISCALSGRQERKVLHVLLPLVAQGLVAGR